MKPQLLELDIRQTENGLYVVTNSLCWGQDVPHVLTEEHLATLTSNDFVGMGDTIKNALHDYVDSLP